MNSSFFKRICCLTAIIFPILFGENVSAQETVVLNWAKRIGGTGADRARDMAFDAAGNIYTTGYYTGTVDFDPGPGIANLISAGSSDIFILKLDADGNFVWAKSVGGNGPDSPMGIAVDALGNVYITGGFATTADFDPGPGVFNLTSAGQTDIYIAKLDPAGNFVWAKGVIGGTWYDHGYKIILDATGNVHVVGRFYYQGGARDFDPGPGTFFLTADWEDIFILKLDNDGNFLWARDIGNVQENRGYSIALDASGNIYTTGYFKGTTDFDPGAGVYNLTSSGDWDVFYSKLDANGNFVWARAMVNSTSTYYSDGNYGRKIALDASGNIYATGRYSGTTDFDFGTGTFNLTSNGGYDIYLLKMTNDGDFVWAKSMGGSGYDEGFSLSVSSTDDVYVTGFFVNTVDFDPSAATFNLTATGSNDDIFVSKFDSNGNFIWASSMGGPNDDQGTNIATNATEDVYVLGWFSGTADFDPGACTLFLSSAGADDLFIQKLNQVTNIPLAITSATPISGPVGATISISGTGFSSVPTKNTVTINSTTASVSASTPTSITITVPVGATTGKIAITVNCVTAQSLADFTVTAAPVIAITTQPSNLSACFEDIVTYSVVASGTTNITYQWQQQQVDFTFSDVVDGGAYSGTNTSTLTVDTGIGAVSLGYRCRINGDLAAQEISSTATLLLLLAPSAPTAIGASGCSPTSLTLSASGGMDGQYRWYTTPTGGTPIAGEVNSSYTTPSITTVTTYYVSLALACESTRIPVIADVNNSPVKPTITSSITPIGGNVSVCSINTLSLTAPPGFNSYAWSNGEATQQITITSSGTYSVIVGNSNGCNSPSSDAINVTVIPEPCTNQSPVFNTTQATTPIAGNISIDLTSLISDVDNNLDLASLKIISQPISGALAEITNTILTINYNGLSFTGSDKITVEVCDLLGSCTQQELTIEVVGALIVYTGISPNGDAFNEKWIIENIESLPDTKDNKVTIYNRWGDLIFESTNYDNDTRVFKGINKSGNEVTSGVYFYKIEFLSGKKPMDGYLTVKR